MRLVVAFFFQFSLQKLLNLCVIGTEWTDILKSCLKLWTPTWPAIVVLKPFLCSVDFMFRVIVLLENKSSPKLPFFCRLQQEFFFFLFCFSVLILVSAFPGPSGACCNISIKNTASTRRLVSGHCVAFCDYNKHSSMMTKRVYFFITIECSTLFQHMASGSQFVGVFTIHKAVTDESLQQ